MQRLFKLVDLIKYYNESIINPHSHNALYILHMRVDVRVSMGVECQKLRNMVAIFSILIEMQWQKPEGRIKQGFPNLLGCNPQNNHI